MILSGHAHCFADNINTDYIIASKYKAKTLDIHEMARHLMEDLDPEFVGRIRPGDFIIGGRNFGCGSSREAAPQVIKAAGIGAVVAISFARIFFRNSINIGLPVFPCDTSFIRNGDELEVDISTGLVTDIATGKNANATPLPQVMVNVIADGGLAAHVRKHGTFVLT
jgi:3-isopropylmalate/(R)-2-methylmalate dehydratase small subunit